MACHHVLSYVHRHTIIFSRSGQPVVEGERRTGNWALAALDFPQGTQRREKKFDFNYPPRIKHMLLDSRVVRTYQRLGFSIKKTITQSFFSRQLWITGRLGSNVA